MAPGSPCNGSAGLVLVADKRDDEMDELLPITCEEEPEDGLDSRPAFDVTEGGVCEYARWCVDSLSVAVGRMTVELCGRVGGLCDEGPAALL
jgi:hypothetical protein